jgi:hypothetical protein
VFTIDTYPPFDANHVHPDPKFATASAENAVKKLATDPHLATIALATFPEAYDPPGVIDFQ